MYDSLSGLLTDRRKAFEREINIKHPAYVRLRTIYDVHTFQQNLTPSPSTVAFTPSPIVDVYKNVNYISKKCQHL